jgi:uncharacterized protein YndB with AHSA1/START domain
MPSATYSVTINRPPSEVFAFVADGEKCPQWRPGVLDIKRVSGDEVGTTYSQGVKGPMGRRIAADYEVTVLEPDRHLEFQTLTGPARPHGRSARSERSTTSSECWKPKPHDSRLVTDQGGPALWAR